MNRNGPIVAVMALGMIFGIASATNAQDSAAEGGSTPEVMSECPMHDQGGKSKGCDMMQDGGMMSGGKSMMRHHGGHHRRHHGGAPMIVINIYPDGGMLTMDHGGRGMMDQPSRQGPDASHGKMSHGGAGMMEHGATTDVDLRMSEKQVRSMMEKHLQRMAEGNLQVGQVTTIDDDLISAEILSEDGGSHGRMVVNRHSGAMMRAN